MSPTQAVRNGAVSIDSLSLASERTSPELQFLFPSHLPHPHYIEYFMGLKKSELCLESTINLISLQPSMSRVLKAGKWSFAPTEETLELMADLQRYNYANPMSRRLHFAKVLPFKEYEYELINLGITDRIFVHGSHGTTHFDYPYTDMPQFKSDIHPFLVAAHCHLTLFECEDWSLYNAALDRLFSLSCLAAMWSCDVPMEFEQAYPDQHGIQPYALLWFTKDPFVQPPAPVLLPSKFSTLITPDPLPRSQLLFCPSSLLLNDHPNQSWWTPGKIAEGGEGLDIWVFIAVTRAHIKLSELGETVRRGEIDVDGKVVMKSCPMKSEDGSVNESIEPGVDIALSNAAEEPVWYFPGFRNPPSSILFEDTGVMYHELITQPDIKTFLPPIGNFTVYMFGDLPLLYSSSPDVHVTLRVHDELYSDGAGRAGGYGTRRVFGCFRKEETVLGEVVRNLRKREEDSADGYFASKEIIIPTPMPDVLHWLGIDINGHGSVGAEGKKGGRGDNMVSTSDMTWDGHWEDI
ncbi:hypothetical protein D9758_015459 [Tetrapyrgos nigripes]|uniref:GTP cyclohydrolase N-terminal domain-containing protein n=1 Tax=Tetrapyrgos nigripes TaxID=182062 RepID=A0A8H5CPN4_9AGAR|nr:hypothetical protein D9758_015459 [Tetrapyrgos nigripes]